MTKDVYNDDLSKDDIKLLEDRWSDYVKNPKAVQTWDEVKSKLIKKHNFLFLESGIVVCPIGT